MFDCDLRKKTKRLNLLKGVRCEMPNFFRMGLLVPMAPTHMLSQCCRSQEHN